MDRLKQRARHHMITAPEGRARGSKLFAVGSWVSVLLQGSALSCMSNGEKRQGLWQQPKSTMQLFLSITKRISEEYHRGAARFGDDIIRV